MNPPGGKVEPGFSDTPPHIPHMQEEFAILCQEAAEYGTEIVLEIMPRSEVRTIETARAVVEGADQPNGGILVDIWHFQRAGIEYSRVSEIPGAINSGAVVRAARLPASAS